MNDIQKHNLEKALNIEFQKAGFSLDESLFLIEKGFGKDMLQKFPNGKWLTINGSRVFTDGGKVVAGLDGFNGKIEDAFKEKKETSTSKKNLSVQKIDSTLKKKRKQRDELSTSISIESKNRKNSHDSPSEKYYSLLNEKQKVVSEISDLNDIRAKASEKERENDPKYKQEEKEFEEKQQREYERAVRENMVTSQTHERWKKRKAKEVEGWSSGSTNNKSIKNNKRNEGNRDEKILKYFKDNKIPYQDRDIFKRLLSQVPSEYNINNVFKYAEKIAVHEGVKMKSEHIAESIQYELMDFKNAHLIAKDLLTRMKDLDLSQKHTEFANNTLNEKDREVSDYPSLINELKESHKTGKPLSEEYYNKFLKLNPKDQKKIMSEIKRHKTAKSKSQKLDVSLNKKSNEDLRDLLDRNLIRLDRNFGSERDGKRRAREQNSEIEKILESRKKK